MLTQPLDEGEALRAQGPARAGSLERPLDWGYGSFGGVAGDDVGSCLWRRQPRRADPTM